MNKPAIIDLDTPALQRAKGRVRLVVKSRAAGQSHTAELRQESAYRVLFPRTQNGVHAVLLNTSGGITGGDRFAVTAAAEAGSTLTLTTQAAERVYRAIGTDAGSVRTQLDVGAGATLHWLPQETILFDGCHLERSLDVTLAADAQFLMVEPLVFGRTASAEVIRQGHLHDRVRIMRGGLPIYLDAVRLRGAVNDLLARPALSGGGCAAASVVCVRPDAALHLDRVRDLLPDTAGASLIGDDLLVMRAVAIDSFVLRQTLVPVLTYLTRNTLPKTWSL